MFKVAVVGSGPSVKIDIFEKLSEPFGLLRFGVAPDHSGVKEKFIRHFGSIFDSKDVQIYINADIGQTLNVSNLSKSYDAVALCTGMSDSKRFWHGIPNSCGADEIFGWYNQNPAYKKLEQDLSKVQRLAIIGNGNVALDMARIFAKKPILLSKDNVVPEVLGVLENTNIQEITIIGRRNLENASFTPAELREFKIFSEYCKITSTPKYEVSKTCHLSRVQVKNIQIMQDLIKGSTHVPHEKVINFKFTSPISSVNYENGHGIVKIRNSNEIMEFDLLIECTGFKQNQKFENLAQDEAGKFIANYRNLYLLKENIYACGWARTGPKGNIADSMSEAFNCAASISTDLIRKGKSNYRDDASATDFRKFKFEKFK